MVPLSEVVALLIEEQRRAEPVVAACRSRGEKRGAYLLPLEIRWPEEEERPVEILRSRRAAAAFEAFLSVEGARQRASAQELGDFRPLVQELRQRR